jgi:hypothetical protein
MGRNYVTDPPIWAHVGLFWALSLSVFLLYKVAEHYIDAKTPLTLDSVQYSLTWPYPVLFTSLCLKPLFFLATSGCQPDPLYEHENRICSWFSKYHYNKSSFQIMLVVHADESPSYFRIKTFSASGTRVIAEYNYPCENTGRLRSSPSL